MLENIVLLNVYSAVYYYVDNQSIVKAWIINALKSQLMPRTNANQQTLQRINYRFLLE